MKKTKNTKIELSHILKLFLMNAELQKEINFFNFIYSIIFVLIPLNISLMISYYQEQLLFIWVASIVVPFLYCFIIPILMEFILKGDDNSFRNYRKIMKKITKSDINILIDEIVHKKINIEFFNFSIELIVKEIRIKKFIKPFSILCLLVSIVIIMITMLDTFNLIS